MEITMIQKTKLKREFNKAGLQITSEAIELLDDHINRQVRGMVSRVIEGNIKRLTVDLIWVALGNYNNR
jgi:hypothetical protein